jgi:hypothetical protein
LTFFSTMEAPICWSPPRAPLENFFTFNPHLCSRRLPVVPVAKRLCFFNCFKCFWPHLIMLSFCVSWATSANFFFMGRECLKGRESMKILIFL